jgi:hypothetical protein
MPTKAQVIAELKRRGYTDQQLRAYQTLMGRGYSHEEIFQREPVTPKEVPKAPPEAKAPTPAEPAPSPRGVMGDMIEELKRPEVLGATAGEIIGEPFGRPAAIGLSGVGGAVGRAAEILGQEIIPGHLREKPTEQIAGKPLPLPEIEEKETFLEDVGKAGARQAAYAATGGVIGKGVGKLLSPFAKRVTKEAKIAIKTLDQYMPKAKGIISPLLKKKVPAILPAEATENRVLDMFQNIAEYSLVGGKRIADYKKLTRETALNQMMDDLVTSFGKKADPDLLGDAIRLTVQKRLKASRLVTEPLYNSAEEMAKNVKIPLDNVKRFAEPLLERAREIRRVQSKAAGDNLLTTISKLDDEISFPAAKELRSRLLSVINEFSVINKKAPAIGKARKIISLIDDSIENTLGRENPEALGIWRQANQLYKEGSKKLDSQFVRRMLKLADPEFGGEPEKILKSIFKRGGISNIRRMKTALGGRRAPIWKQMKAWYVQDIIQGATKNEAIQGSKMLESLYGRTGMGKKALREIFDLHELNALESVAKTLKVVQERQAEGTGRMLIQLTQGGAALTVLGLAGERTGGQAAAGAILFGPAVLSRMFVNPMAAKWLSTGLKLPKHSGYAISLSLRLSRLANKIEQEIEEQKIED